MEDVLKISSYVYIEVCTHKQWVGENGREVVYLWKIIEVLCHQKVRETKPCPPL